MHAMMIVHLEQKLITIKKHHYKDIANKSDKSPYSPIKFMNCGEKYIFLR